MAGGLSNRAAATLIGCTHRAIGEARRKGQLTALPDGSLAADEVQRWNSERRSARGGYKTTDTKPRVVSDPVSNPAPVSAPLVSVPGVDGAAAVSAREALALLDEAGVFAKRADAERYRESYMALLRQVEYEEKIRSVARVDLMSKAFGEGCARVKTRLSALPAEVAPELFRKKTIAEIVEELRRAINEVLAELVNGDWDPAGTA